MVTALYTPGLIKIEYEFTLGDRNWFIIRWLMSGAHTNFPYTTTDLNSVATQAQSAFSHIQAFTTTDTTWVGTTAQDFGSDTGLVGSATAGGTGTEDPPTLPVQNAAAIDWKIERRYRGGHPKSFLSGIAEARVTANRLWTSGFQTGLEAAAVATQAALNEVGITHGSSVEVFTHVNRSTFTGHTERPSNQIDPIVGSAIQPVVASQRRRRGRA